MGPTPNETLTINAAGLLAALGKLAAERRTELLNSPGHRERLRGWGASLLFGLPAFTEAPQWRSLEPCGSWRCRVAGRALYFFTCPAFFFFAKSGPDNPGDST